ncbi:type II toxin-antitoxin system PemK/MazF family toxin [uncultured Thiodictyon sp.]|uniref:type II toxin-antitoxin system PemK/MazF family toxin n=1 Tax=uncultured Thiodictyon sp. TaxID=1846217 RepID=UPI0025CDB00E|nr:type II toxin-antitoxin system PemK/MazF family toxin [uncultured Thiodictyon sp.]
MNCKPGDLVLIPFPSADLQSPKRRRVLVLTAPNQHGDFIALAVTSVQPPEHGLEIGKDALTSGALPCQSWVRQDKIFTLSEDDSVRAFGRVTPDFLRNALAGLRELVGQENSSTQRPG